MTHFHFCKLNRPGFSGDFLLDQLRNQLENTVGRPEEIFIKMIGEGIQELGIGVPSILAMLQR